MNFLKRELAPLVDEAWSEIEEEAVRVLKANLSARHIVDFDGPKGFDFSSINLGALSTTEEADGIHFGVRKVLPLIEIRVPFSMSVWDLDNLARGAQHADMDPVVQAALKVASFEERAIYRGFGKAGIRGLGESAVHKPVGLGENPGRYPDGVADAMLTLSDAGVGGPYALVLGPRLFRRLTGDVSTYPPRQRIAKMIEGPVLHSPVLDGGYLLSLRGGDFQLTVGQDLSIGYEHHDNKTVSLYLTETFTFRVLGPEALIELKPS